MATLQELLEARKKAQAVPAPIPVPIPTQPARELQSVLEPTKQSTALSTSLSTSLNPNPTPKVEQAISSTQVAPTPRDIPRDPRLDRDLVAKIDQLAYDLQEASPNIGEALRYIHRALLQDPVQVTVLNDTERSIFFQGLMRHSTTEIIAKATKKRTPKAGKEALSVDDFM